MHVVVCLLGLTLWLVEANSRNVVQTLTVLNGEGFGSWGQARYCGSGSFALGYNMKIEERQGGSDDTALNGIELICRALDGYTYGGSATSSVGNWGDWVGPTSCYAQGGKPHFLTSFNLQVEPWSRRNDDTAANYVKFKCRDFAGSQRSYELSKDPGFGFWGSYGSWSSECPKNSAICGIATKVEGPQGRGDDTALNDVKFYCCSL